MQNPNNALKGVKYNDKDDMYKVQSFSRPDIYIITPFRISGTFRCTCMDFIYRRDGQGNDCKHIERIKVIDNLRIKGLVKVDKYDETETNP